LDFGFTMLLGSLKFTKSRVGWSFAKTSLKQLIALPRSS